MELVRRETPVPARQYLMTPPEKDGSHLLLRLLDALPPSAHPSPSARPCRRGPGCPPGTPCRRAGRDGRSAPASPSRTASSGAAGPFPGLPGSHRSPGPLPLRRHPEVRLLPSTGITRLLRYSETLRLPARPPPKVTLRTRSRSHPGLPRCAREPFVRAIPTTPVDHHRCSLRSFPAALRPSRRLGPSSCSGSWWEASSSSCRSCPFGCGPCPRVRHPRQPCEVCRDSHRGRVGVQVGTVRR